MIKLGDTVIISQKEYKLLKLLGHGKSGYSYLAMSNNVEYVIKQIHHEPCTYYTFGNKIKAELFDYNRLLSANVRIPKLLDFDEDRELIVK